MKPVASRFRGDAGGSSGGTGGGGSAGDSQDWERVMHTKLAQWRYMHLVALDELSSAEGAACSEISNLAKILEAQTCTLHGLELQLTKLRAVRQKDHFITRARPALQLLETSLNNDSNTNNEVCEELVLGLRKLRVPPGAIGEPEKLPGVLRRFRACADAFVETAKKNHRIADSEAAASALTQLEKVAIGLQQDALTNAAKQVADAADAMDAERAGRATDVINKERRTSSVNNNSNNTRVYGANQHHYQHLLHRRESRASSTSSHGRNSSFPRHNNLVAASAGQRRGKSINTAALNRDNNNETTHHQQRMARHERRRSSPSLKVRQNTHHHHHGGFV